MALAMGQILQQQAVVNNAPEDYSRRIAHLKPNVYKGEEDPVILEDWIREFDKVLDAVNCPPDQRVNGAVYYLRGEADTWWSINGAALLAQPEFDWDAFKTALRARFYPEHVRMEKYNEFIELKQRSMTVKEYHAKFLELSRFASTVVPDEATKVQRFVNGLNWNLQKALTVLTLPTLEFAYGKAANLYGVQQRERAVQANDNKRRGDSRDGGGSQTYAQNQEKRPRHFDNRGQRFNGNQGNAQRPGNANQNQNQRGQQYQAYPNRHYHCKACGQNHPGTDCSGNLVKCYACNKMGHRAFECMVKKPTGNGQQQRPNGGNRPNQ